MVDDLTSQTSIDKYQKALAQRAIDIANAEAQVKAFNPQMQRTTQQLYRQTPSDVAKLKTLEFQRGQQKEQTLADISKASAETTQMEAQLKDYLKQPAGIKQYSEEYNIEPTVEMVNPGLTADGRSQAPVPVYTYTTPYGTYVDDSALKAVEEKSTVQSLVYKSGSFKPGETNELALTPSQLAATAGMPVEKAVEYYRKDGGYIVTTPYGSISTQFPDKYTGSGTEGIGAAVTKDLSRVAALDIKTQGKMDFATGLTQNVPQVTFTMPKPGITGMGINGFALVSAAGPKDINIVNASRKDGLGVSSRILTGNVVGVDSSTQPRASTGNIVTRFLGGITKGYQEQAKGETYIPGVKAFGTVSAAGEKATLEFRQPTMFEAQQINLAQQPINLGAVAEKYATKLGIDYQSKTYNIPTGIKIPETPIYQKSTIMNFGTPDIKSQFIIPERKVQYTPVTLIVNPERIGKAVNVGIQTAAFVAAPEAVGPILAESIWKTPEISTTKKVIQTGLALAPLAVKVGQGLRVKTGTQIGVLTKEAEVKAIEPVFVQTPKLVEEGVTVTGEPRTALTYEILGKSREASVGRQVEVFTKSFAQRVKSSFFGTNERTPIFSGNPYKDRVGYLKAKELLTGKLYDIGEAQWLKSTPKQAAQMISSQKVKLSEPFFKGMGAIVIRGKENPQVMVTGAIKNKPQVIEYGKTEIGYTQSPIQKFKSSFFGTTEQTRRVYSQSAKTTKYQPTLTQVRQPGEVLPTLRKLPEFSRYMSEPTFTKMYLTKEGYPFQKLSQAGKTTEAFKQASAAKQIAEGKVFLPAVSKKSPNGIINIGKEFPAKVFKEVSASRRMLPSGRLGKLQSGRSTIINIEAEPTKISYEPPFKVSYEPVVTPKPQVTFDEAWLKGLKQNLESIYGKQAQTARNIMGQVRPSIPSPKAPTLKSSPTLPVIPKSTSLLPSVSAASVTSVYAGTGQYEKSTGGLLPGSLGQVSSGRGITSMAIQEPSIKATQEFLQPQVKSTQEYLQPSILNEKVIVQTLQPQLKGASEILQPKIREQQQQPQLQLISQRVIPRLKTEIIPAIKTTQVPRPPIIKSPPREPPTKKFRFNFDVEADIGKKAPKKIALKKGPVSYIPQIKKAGKFVSIGEPTTKGRALLLGAKAVRQTLAATFRAQPVNIVTRDTDINYVPNQRIFRTPKGKASALTYVQRKGITEGAPIGSGGRLSSYGERAAITTARKARPSLRVKIGKIFNFGGRKV